MKNKFLSIVTIFVLGFGSAFAKDEIKDNKVKDTKETQLSTCNNKKLNINYEFEMIQSVIPNTQIKKYKKSIIDGFYNVYFENGQIIYVNPFKKIILLGEIWNSSGNSITGAEREKWINELKDGGKYVSREDKVIENLKKTDTKTIDWNKELVKKAIKFGKGGNKDYKVVTILSPYCPHCKALSKYLETFLNTTYRIYSNAPGSVDIYKKMNIKEPEKRLVEQNKFVDEKVSGIGVPFGIILDKDNKVIDTILGFSEQSKTNLDSWNKYLK